MTHCTKACALGCALTAVTFHPLVFIASAVVFPIATSCDKKKFTRTLLCYYLDLTSLLPCPVSRSQPAYLTGPACFSVSGDHELILKKKIKLHWRQGSLVNMYIWKIPEKNAYHNHQVSVPVGLYVRSTVYTNPSRKRSFSKPPVTLFKPEKFENAGVAFLPWTKNNLKTEFRVKRPFSKFPGQTGFRFKWPQFVWPGPCVLTVWLPPLNVLKRWRPQICTGFKEANRKQWKKHSNQFTLTLHHSGMLERISCVKLTPEGLKNTANDGTPSKKRKSRQKDRLAIKSYLIKSIKVSKKCITGWFSLATESET